MFPALTYKITLKGKVIEVVQKGECIVWPKDFALQAHQKFNTSPAGVTQEPRGGYRFSLIPS